MMSLLSGTRALRTSAVLVLTGAVLSGPVAMFVVALVSAQPAWTSVSVFADHYHPVQGLPYLLGYLLLSGFVFFSASCHALAPAPLRPRTAAALVFTAIYASLVFTNYTIQLGFVPRVLDGRPAYVAELTMANPASFAWFLEMFGYAAMGAATWLVAPAFGGNRRADAIRYLLVANGVLSIVGAACTAIFDRWVFSTAGMVSFAPWNALIPACYLLIATIRGGGLEEPVDEQHAPAEAGADMGRTPRRSG
jgi:hypothetical protein